MDWKEIVNFKQPDAKRAIQIESNSIFKIGPSELLSSVSKRGLLQIDRMDGLLSWTIMYITPDVFKKYNGQKIRERNNLLLVS